jgi:hypothetical protein
VFDTQPSVEGLPPVSNKEVINFKEPVACSASDLII